MEDADVRVLARDPPEMRPFALYLQLCGPLMFQDTQLFDFFRVRVIRDADNDAHVEQHSHFLGLAVLRVWRQPRLSQTEEGVARYVLWSAVGCFRSQATDTGL